MEATNDNETEGRDHSDLFAWRIVSDLSKEIAFEEVLPLNWPVAQD